MRTTVTIDDDIALQLEQRRAERGQSFKDTLNETLREGLAPRPVADGRSARTPVFDLGRSAVPLDDVAEALAYAEGEDFR